MGKKWSWEPGRLTRILREYIARQEETFKKQEEDHESCKHVWGMPEEQPLHEKLYQQETFDTLPTASRSITRKLD